MATENAGSGTPGNAAGTQNGNGGSPENNGGVQIPSGWTAGLQDAENREVVTKKGWDKSNSPDVVITSYRELESRLGKSVVIPDAATATQDDYTKLYTALGRPDKPDGYALKLPEGVPAGLPYDDAFATEYKGWAHQAGLDSRQAQSVHDKFVQRAAKQMDDAVAAQTAKVGAAHRDIVAKWGEADTAGYKRNVELAGRALRNLGLTASYKAVGLVTQTGEITDAATAFALAKMGEAMFKEDGQFGAPGNLTQSNPWKEGQENLTEQGRIQKESPDTARALIIAAGKDPDKALYKSTR